MTDLTPERIRAAAEVVSMLYGNTDIRVTGNNLRAAADKLEREQAAKAQRERRIKGLTDEMVAIAWPDDPFPLNGVVRVMDRVARGLVDKYPALVESPACGKGPCCLSAGHEGRCEL